MPTKVAYEDGKIHFVREQDCTPILEDIAARRSAGLVGSSDMKHAARIPEEIVNAYCIRNNVSFQDFCKSPEHIKTLLNDPCLAHFRIWKGKV